MAWFLFPGQGSQKPGMGQDLYEAFPAARAIFDEANVLAGGAWVDTIFNADAEALKNTRLAQPALLACDVAVFASLTEKGIVPEGTAGHSLGEFAALVAAGALSFSDAFRAVIERARLMHELAPDGGMLAVLGLGAAAIESALPEGAYVANYNGDAQTLVAGSHDSLADAAEALKAAGARRALPVAVSGPFHTPLMNNAAQAFRDVLATLEIEPPNYSFVSSVSGKQETDPARIRQLLGEQIAAPVRWTDAMQTIGERDALECGPGTILAGLAKRTEGAPSVAPMGTAEAIASLAV